MNIKSDYYKLDSQAFKKKLVQIKEDENTLTFFANTKTPYFYCESPEINEKILQLNKKQWQFDQLFNQFSEFGKNQLLQSFLIDEINSTNEIENVFSTRHEIFYLLKNGHTAFTSKIKAIVRTYALLLSDLPKPIESNEQIRTLYDEIFCGSIEKDDLPDGVFYRKGPVHISDGVQNVHTGFYPESLIIDTMNETVKMVNCEKETYLKNIIAHFMFETIHPFYDGNGRLGRFLFSSNLLLETKSYYALLISKAFNSRKSDYYKAFKEGRDIHQFGCINEYVTIVLSILIDSIDKENKRLSHLYDAISSSKAFGKTKSEIILYQLLTEATMLSDYGVSNEELMKYSSLSKRTIITVINHFKEQGLLNEHPIGKTTYHQLKKFHQ